ncbi:hypothetical protein SNE40_005431 [Patella caerulea]|uniref:Beta-1,3-galactosyl-O-glycosyl-glycoprotein beta-1,6-N-acetylglucosaminyltransferase n=1 Tax=Patella caerulea TaxID=87958 RepID=A0AAN8K1N9_PATCE
MPNLFKSYNTPFLAFENRTVYMELRTKPQPPPAVTSVKEMCQRLLPEKNTAYIQEAQRYMALHPRTVILPESYKEYTSNCSRFVSDRGYIVDKITDEEMDFPIAFTLMVYKHVGQVERLLRAIYRPQNVYCIHMDKKSSSVIYNALKSIVSCLPNVFMASRRVDVIWGQFSVLEPEIICLRDLYEHKVKWRYVINLTGQEYPLKTNYQLVKILQAYKGANDIEGAAKILNRDRTAGRPRPPGGISPCKGSLHFTASRQFIDYVLHNKTAQDFLEWCKLIGTPDETYFTSLNNNKHLKIPGSYIGDREKRDRDFFSRYKIWYSKTVCGSGYFRHSVCIMGVADLPDLTKAPHLFVNKLLYEFEPLTFDCLEQWYMDQVTSEMGGNLNFSTTLYEQSTIVKYRYIPPS